MKSVMGHKFSTIPQANIARSSFDRSHGYKSSFNAGDLIPFYVDEVVPGDTFNLRMSALARIATLLKPPMDNMYLDTHFFFVPTRLVWDNFVKMHGEQTDPGDSTDFVVPTITSPTNGYTTGSLADYMGIPVGVEGLVHSALPMRCYQTIYNNWYRDQNLIDSLTENRGDGPDGQGQYVVQKRGKRHDYFTSALPFAQKGTAVNLPWGTTAPVVTNSAPIQLTSNDAPNTQKNLYIGGTSGPFPPDQLGVIPGTPSSNEFARFGAETGLVADLTLATSQTVNVMREAFQLQRLLERDARGGTRYPEILKNHYGVTDPQFDVLQRPQYLGGGTTPVHIHIVPQSSASGAYATTPQGELTAFGTVQVNGHGFSKSFTEFGFVLGILSVRADLTYQRGLDRMWSRSTRYDHYYPALAMLGEQAILNKEIYAQGNAADADVFGYQERWAELRYKNSKITGLLNSNATPGPSLDVWHLSQDFANLPVLNKEFIEEDVPVDRIIAVPTEPHFILDAYINLKCARPLPTYSVPGMIDHL